MQMENKMQISFLSRSENEAFARVAVAAFVSQLDPTLEEISEIKTAVSEAVTNAIIHGYENKSGTVYIECAYEGEVVEVIVRDSGNGIRDVEKAREPLYTSKPELERSGMGFTVMESFMDQMEVESKYGQGTCVRMIKNLGRSE